MIIEENGKLYNLDLDKGIVTEAASKEAGLSADPQKVDTMEEDRPVSIGAHVEAEGKLGEVVATTESVYGTAYGVSFEDGSFDEYSRESLKVSKVAKVAYSSPLTEVVDRYASYQELPAFTEQELDAKDSEARFLNLRAKALITTGKNTYESERLLDEIIVATTADLLDIKEAKEAVVLENNKDYLSSTNHFSLQGDVFPSGPTLGHNEDASWLDDAEFENFGHTDTELAERAAEVVNNFTHEQLNDANFIATASSFQQNYLGLNELGNKKFAAYLDLARRERLKEPEKKTAKVEEDVDLDSFDTSAFYLSGE